MSGNLTTMEDDYIATLRNQAEAILNQPDIGLNPDTIANITEILEKLVAHRPDLEVQHEILQTAYIELERKLSKYVNLYQVMPIGYMNLDVNGFIQEANEACCQLLQTSHDRIIGKCLTDFISRQEQIHFDIHLHKLFTEHALQVDEFHIIRSDNTAINVEVLSRPPRDESSKLCQMVISDITHTKRYVIDVALQETALLLTNSLDLDIVLKHILESVTQIVPCDATFVALWDKDKQSLELVQSHGIEPLIVARQLYVPFTATLKTILEAGEPYLLFNKLESESWPNTTRTGRLVRSYIVCPLFILDELLGFLWVGSYQNTYFTPQHVQDLQMFARQASLAVNNARHYDQSQKLGTMKERQRIARELHDAVKQNLFSASLIADSLREHEDNLPQETSQHLLYLHESLKQALAEMRILLDELQPEHILNLSDKDMLKRLSKRLSNADIKVRINTRLDAALPIPIKVVIYRILQEALTNIETHANAKQVHIQLSCTAEHVSLVIEDDGIGFDPTTTLKGHGLHNMRQRVKETNGHIDMQSQKTGGTRIAITWELTVSA
jgi:PAS domain S-box-containing protein